MKGYKPYLFLALSLLVILSLPKVLTTTLRGKAAALLAPIWEGAGILKECLACKRDDARQLHIETIQLENTLLYEELSRLQTLCEYKDVVLQKPLLAKVIFRESASWSHTLWINVGQKQNIAKNSPVVLGNAIVGVVEDVQEGSSLVRLITDPGMHPSVRIARGGLQNQALITHIDALTQALECHKELASKELGEMLQALRSTLQAERETSLLAKGELCGAVRSKWRGKDLVLRGIGFNYDFADEAGPSRDLRTGKSLFGKSPTMPLIQAGDLLITTGMDGIFPQGLHAGEVFAVPVLQEGAIAYEIEALPPIPNFDELEYLFVLSPLIDK